MTRWWVAGGLVLMLVALFVGGAQPQAVGLFAEPWDKVAHAAFFFVLAFLVARFFSFPVVAVLLIGLAVAASDEVHQIFLPGRVAGWDDGVADAVGIVLGLALASVRR